MQMAKAYLLKNIAPPLAAIFICLFGSFTVYKTWHEGPDSAARLARLEPAAGPVNYIPVDYDKIPAWDGKRLIER